MRPRSAGVGHYVALSIVGVDGLPDSGYMRAKVAQEKIITESGLPYTIVRATQFAEFTDAITDSMTVGDEVRVPDALIQPIAADDGGLRRRPRGRRRAAQRHREHRWAGKDLVRADGSRRRWPGGATTRPSSSTRKAGVLRHARCDERSLVTPD